ncbi:MAG: hypothetical protein AAB221_08640, partial [Bacteroidota bacterium]
EVRYTKEGKKIYNNPELGLYFEYPVAWMITGDKYFPYLKNPNVYIGKGQFIILSTNDNQRVEIRLTSADFYIEGTEEPVNPLRTTIVDLGKEVLAQIKQVYPACSVDFSDFTGGKWTTLFNISFFGLPQLHIDSFTQPFSKFDNVYVSFDYAQRITNMTEGDIDKITYADQQETYGKLLNNFCQTEVLDDIMKVKGSLLYKDYTNILRSMIFQS